MPHRAQNRSLAAKSVALSAAVPQVVAYRVARMAQAGSPVSERDRREFQRMVNEKPLAFAETWVAMAWEAVRINQSIFASAWTWFLNPLSGRWPAAAILRSAPARLLSTGLEPSRRRAVANAKRLSKSRRR